MLANAGGYDRACDGREAAAELSGGPPGQLCSVGGDDDCWLEVADRDGCYLRKVFAAPRGDGHMVGRLSRRPSVRCGDRGHNVSLGLGQTPGSLSPSKAPIGTNSERAIGLNAGMAAVLKVPT